jgi:Reverse transcriptase (RNA-dependent DNA polymerase)
MPPPQEPATRRRFVEQHMHCDIMYVNKKPVLVSRTEPVGVVLCACIENVSAPILRQSIRRFFGTFGSRGMSVVKFTSDNERGLTALFGDMDGMGVQVVTVGAGQHAHIIERTIRTFKEVIRTSYHSVPYKMPDFLLLHLILNACKKLLFFPTASTRTDNMSPFQAMEGRNIDLKRDVGPPFGSYCEVAARSMTNGNDARTRTCIYLDSRLNGTGTHTFLTLDTQQVISANHYVVLPITDLVIQTINGWAAKNKNLTSTEPLFTFHERDITHDAPEDEFESMTAAAPLESVAAPLPLPPAFRPILDEAIPSATSPRPMDPSEIGGVREETIVSEVTEPTPDVIPGPEELLVDEPGLTPEAEEPEPANVRTHRPKAPLEPREKSTRIRKPTVRFNLGTTTEPRATLEQTRSPPTALMSVMRGLKLFPAETGKAIELEVAALLNKTTFLAVDGDAPPHNMRKRTLRSIMNVVEKYLPTLDADGNRALDKVKARLCVDGRGQDRGEYRLDDIESPTANIASILTVAQIAAAEERFVMVGDVGSAYLNASMPMDDPSKILYMLIEPDVAREIIKQDKAFAPYQRRNGSLIVILNKALYGCIESAKLWYNELAGTLKVNGFVPNPRDICVFNKKAKGTQITIVVYVDDLMMTSTDKSIVLDMERILLKTYGQFRTSHEKIVSYLGCTWNFHEKGFVKVSQTGMIQDLITSRENTHRNRGTELTGSPLSPGAPYLFDRTPDAPRLSVADAKTFHTDVATALFIANRSKPVILPVIGELCGRVKDPSVEDDKKLDRLIAYLRGTRDIPLRLGCTMPPRVTVSIDAAFANRTNMKSTSGMCVTLGVGNFITSSKTQKLNSKSSTEAEIIAVSDGMNIPLWLADFIAHQGYKKQPVRLEQDNQSCIALLNKGRSTAETTRFIEVRMFWISDYIRIGAVDVVYVPTEEMTSDFFTKPLQGALFSKMSKKIMGN